MNSRMGSTAIGAIAVAATVVAVLAATPGANAGTPTVAPCTATFQPDSIRILQEPTTVAYGLSEDIGGITAVVPADESGIEVLAFNVEDKTLNLNTGGALEGVWTLRFVGDAELTCSGTVTVLMASAGLR